MRIGSWLAGIGVGLLLLNLFGCNPGDIGSNANGRNDSLAILDQEIDPSIGAYCYPDEADRCSNADPFSYFSCTFDEFLNAFTWQISPCPNSKASCSKDWNDCRGFDDTCESIKRGLTCASNALVQCENSQVKAWWHCALGCSNDSWGYPRCNYREETFRQRSSSTRFEKGQKEIASSLFVLRDYEIKAAQVSISLSNSDAADYFLDPMSCVELYLTHGGKKIQFGNNEPWTDSSKDDLPEDTNFNYRYEFSNDSSSGYWTLTLVLTQSPYLSDFCDPNLKLNHWALKLLSE